MKGYKFIDNIEVFENEIDATTRKPKCKWIVIGDNLYSKDW